MRHADAPSYPPKIGSTGEQVKSFAFGTPPLASVLLTMLSVRGKYGKAR